MHIATPLRGVEQLEDRNLLTTIVGSDFVSSVGRVQGVTFSHEINQNNAVELSPAQRAAAEADGYWDMSSDEQVAYAREQGLALLELIMPELSKPKNAQSETLDQWMNEAWAWGNEEERLLTLDSPGESPPAASEPAESSTPANGSTPADHEDYSDIRLSEAQLQTAYDDGYLEMTQEEKIAYTGQRGLDLMELILGEMSKPKAEQDAAQLDAWIEEGFGWGNLQIELIMADRVAFDNMGIAAEQPTKALAIRAIDVSTVRDFHFDGLARVSPLSASEFRFINADLPASVEPIIFGQDLARSEPADEPLVSRAAPAPVTASHDHGAFESAVDSLLAELAGLAAADRSFHLPTSLRTEAEEPADLLDASLENVWGE